MRKKRNNSRRFGRVRILAMLTLLYFLFTVAYYFLPWSVRQTYYRRFPFIDRTLVRTGYKIVAGWDGLGVWGRDSKTALGQPYDGQHVFAGNPSQDILMFDRVKILNNQSYSVGYSESMKNPLWVSYRVFDVPTLDSGKRPSSFRIDHRTEAKVSHGDYRGSGYDRGHMAPNYAIATRYGGDGQWETFLMSNIIPQRPMVNRFIWKEIEQSVARKYGRYFGEIWVTTGPIFTGEVKRLSSGVAIPTAYYKILADEYEGGVRVMAFVIESRPPPYTRIKSRLVSVDDIELITGLDFFPELPQEAQTELESRVAGRLWPWLLPAAWYNLKF